MAQAEPPNQPPNGGGENPAVNELLERCGGIRPLATALGLSASTIQGWKRRGSIPPNRHLMLRRAVPSLGVSTEVLEAALLEGEPREAEVRPVVPVVPVASIVRPEPAAPAPPVAPPPVVRAAPAKPAPPPPAPPVPPAAPPPVAPVAKPVVRPAASASKPASKPTSKPASKPVAKARGGKPRGVRTLVALIIIGAIGWFLLRSRTTTDSLVSAFGGDGGVAEWGAPAVLVLLAAVALFVARRAKARPARIVRAALAIVLIGGIGWFILGTRSAPEGGGVVRVQVQAEGGEGGEDASARPAVSLLRRLLPRDQAPDLTLYVKRDEYDALATRHNATASRADALETRFQLLEQEVAALRESARSLLRSQGEIGAEILALERVARARPRESAAQVLILSQLRVGVDAGQPFREHLEAALKLLPEQAALLAQALEGHADKGIPARRELITDFQAVQERALQAWLERKGWWGRALSLLPGQLEISQVGQARGTDAPAQIGRAEQALAQGRLAQAVLELEAVQGTPALALKPWLQAARARLSAEAALAQAQAKSLEKLARGVIATDGAEQEGEQEGGEPQ